MNQIPDAPKSVSNAGLNFNYALWTAGTVLTLATVPWDSDYKNVMSFPTAGGLDSYLNSQADTLKVQNMKHMRLDQPIRIDAPFEYASLYNYVRAHNPSQPVTGGSLPSTYYYFIQSVTYTAPNTTTLNLQLDVWATFFPSVELGRCYVERGHIGIANEEQMFQRGRNYLTVPEGMDLGSEYEIAHSVSYEIASAFKQIGDKTGYSIMVTSTSDLEKDVDDEPIVTTSSGSELENLPNGTSIYFFKDRSVLRQFLDYNRERAWVTQSIVGITVVPPMEAMSMALTSVTLPGVSTANQVFTVMDGGGTIAKTRMSMFEDWTTSMDESMPTRYKNLLKFQTYPYSFIEMTSFTGQPLVIKPQNLDTKKLGTTIVYHLNPGSGKITFVPEDYNAGTYSNSLVRDGGVVVDRGEWYDFMGTIATLPTFSTVSSGQSAYLATNKNQIAFEHKNATWDQQRALFGAQTAEGVAKNTMKSDLDQAQVGMQQIGQTANQNNETETGRAIVGGTQAAMGGFSQAAGGNPVGGAINGVTGAGASYANMHINQLQNTAMSNINQMAMGKQANLKAGAQEYGADKNKGFADTAARGDYANAIAGIQAKVQDAQAIQSTVTGQIGGDAFTLSTIGWNLYARVKMMQGQALAEVGEYWLRYGYMINRWVNPPADLLVCQKMTYWKMQDANVFALACPEQYRQTIRGILEKGVTVWKNPNDIGRLDPANNDPLEGISY